MKNEVRLRKKLVKLQNDQRKLVQWASEARKAMKQLDELVRVQDYYIKKIRTVTDEYGTQVLPHEAQQILDATEEGLLTDPGNP